MIIKRYQRGDGFVFTAEPQDIDGDPADVDSATLNINFRSDNTAAVDGREDSGDITMTVDTAGEVWTGEWTSRGIGALAGRVYWSIQTINPDSNESGSFDLDVNLANQAE